jgi:ubiquinone/menaquinone biosynthesis C-methylase UbiE
MNECLRSHKIKESNRLIFNRDSSRYHKKRRIKFDRASALKLKNRYEEAMGSDFKRAEMVLDLGCGGGHIILSLSGLGLIGRGFGIDISSGMLKECLINAGNLGATPLLAEADAEFLPFKDKSFDLIIGHAVLHHLPEVDKVLSELKRVLKDGGACIFTEPARVGSRIISVILWIVWFIPMLIRQLTKKEAERSVEIDSFDAKELEKAAKRAGFARAYTRPFAGFLSRIFYWVMDPLSQRISNRRYHLVLERVMDVLYVFDQRFLKHFLPKGWFDELFIRLEKTEAQNSGA